jgi:septal ring factor EnvC (AmiA/AmiB activator)
MNHLTSASASVAIDPTLLALLTVFGAAIVSALTSLIVVQLQRVGEHRSWLRDRRLDAYTGYVVAMESYEDTQRQLSEIGQTLAEASKELDELHRMLIDGQIDVEQHDARVRSMQARLSSCERRQQEVAARARAIDDRVSGQIALFKILGPSRVADAAHRMPSPSQVREDPASHRRGLGRVMFEMQNALK